MSRTASPPGPSAPLDAGKLGSLLDKSERVKETVVEAGDDLVAVNADISAQQPVGLPTRTVDRSKRAEEKVVQAASDLQEVNTQLEQEVAARAGIESRLAGVESALVRTHDELVDANAREGEARYHALHDSATGLANRDLFNERLDHALLQARRHKWKLAVLFVDLDDFKTVNDTHGHHIGDALLKAVALRLEASVRAEDTVSRFGGDEFMCLLLDVQSKEAAAEIAKKMVGRISENCEIDGVVLRPIASIGIALYPDDGTTVDALLKVADKRMYRVKRTPVSTSAQPL